MAKKATQATGVVLPANLSFLRSVEPTSGLMQAVRFHDGVCGLSSLDNATLTSVEVTATTVRGTIANDSKDAPEKRVGTGEKALNSANIATVEQALLAADADHLLVTSTVRFAGHAASPAMCNSPSFAAVLKDLVQAYSDAGGFAELALRYVLNLANGSWLWRNRFGERYEVALRADDLFIVFGEEDIDMTNGFSINSVVEHKRASFEALVAQVELGLRGEKTVALQVQGLVKMGLGAEVYPSQEFAGSGTEKVVKGPEADKVAKILSKQRDQKGHFVATIHARKIGNAIRTIDTWHDHEGIVLAVEPFGANTHQGQAYRVSGNDLYTYLKKPQALLDALRENGLQDEHHFTMACLVRGGVFGFAEASKSAKDAGEE